MLSDSEWAAVDAIPGWLTRAEGDLLAEYATAPWLELGAWKGRSTVVLKHGGSPGYVVDTFAGSGEPECPAGSSVRGEWERNVGWPCWPPLTVLQGPLHEQCYLAPSGIRLLYLDGPHDYTSTRLAWTLYSSHVARDGVAILHDCWGDQGERENTPWPGVTQLVNEVLAEGKWVEVESVERIAVLGRR